MSANNRQLREGIIAKLKDYEAYVDNELPDYIMVMLANNKTVHQINNDLQLFLGENTDRFTEWLQQAMTNPSVLMETTSKAKEKEETDSERREPPPPLAGNKRQHSVEEDTVELQDYDEDEDWERETTPPLEVAAAMVRAEEKRRKEKERERVKERKREREEEMKGGSPAKVMKLSSDESKSGGQKSQAVVKKIIKVLQPPDSTRDQDLRELIAQRRKEKSHRRSPDKREGSDGEVSSDNEGSGGQNTSMASVVKLVRTERPHRTDKGGSRLLHRAILGIKSEDKKMSKSRERKASGGSGSKEKGDDAVQATRTKGTSTSKQSTAVATKSSDQDVVEVVGGDGSSVSGEGVEEVLVEVVEEGALTKGAFVDEFRQEQQLEKSKAKLFRDEMEKSTIAAIKKVLPLGGRVKLAGVRTSKNRKVKRSPVAERSRERGDEEEEGEKGEDEEKEVDLREIINRKNKNSSESTTRFVVTLTGASDEYTNSMTSDDLDEEEEGGPSTGGKDVRALQKTLLRRNSRFNNQAVEAAMTTHQVVKQDDDNKDYEEDLQGGRGVGGLPERCRFWPNCKNGDSCPFHHPSVACRLFPNCKYGNKCHFIHPQCKFDARCTRADCPYLHTAPRHLGFSSQVLAPPPAPPTIIPQPVFTPFPSRFSYGGASPWQQPRPQRYPNKSALSWTPGKGAHISERRFAVPDDQSSVLPI